MLRGYSSLEKRIFATTSTFYLIFLDTALIFLYNLLYAFHLNTLEESQISRYHLCASHLNVNSHFQLILWFLFQTTQYFSKNKDLGPWVHLQTITGLLCGAVEVMDSLSPSAFSAYVSMELISLQTESLPTTSVSLFMHFDSVPALTHTFSIKKTKKHSNVLSLMMGFKRQLFYTSYPSQSRHNAVQPP